MTRATADIDPEYLDLLVAAAGDGQVQAGRLSEDGWGPLVRVTISATGRRALEADPRAHTHIADGMVCFGSAAFSIR
jgi:hypothetical protein